MFWTFCLFPFQPPTVLPQGPTQTAPVPVSSSRNSDANNEGAQDAPEKVGIEINLTPAQLLEAGYETNKKAWTGEEDAALMHLFRKGDLNWK